MNKIKIGDVFEIETPKGKSYFQIVFDKPKEGSLIRVLNGLYKEEPNIKELVNIKEKFLIYFPLKYALKKGIVKKTNNFSVPQYFKLPKKMRTPVVDKEGNLKYWHIVDLTTLEREKVDKLSDMQKTLSPYGIWNDTLLIERLVTDWSLDNWKE